EGRTMATTVTALGSTVDEEPTLTTTAEATKEKAPKMLKQSHRLQSLKEDFSSVNPFVNATPEPGVYEWFKIVLFTVTLIAPLRLLLVILSFVMAWLFAYLRFVSL